VGSVPAAGRQRADGTRGAQGPRGRALPLRPH
jgi:hypothetical protein